MKQQISFVCPNIDFTIIFMTFVKHFGRPCGNASARTLPASAVTDEDLQYDNDFGIDTYTRTHESGWTITAVIHCDWYFWVNYFVANHPKYGWIYGDFEEEITCLSEKAFDHFYKNHPPELWDYGDI